MTLNILISTIDNRILNLQNILSPYSKNIIYTISHQKSKDISDEVKQFIENILQREDVIYSSVIGKGVARNRNNILTYVKPSTLCLILDDDVILCDQAFESVVKSFDENPNADFISFKILDLDGNDYKPYPTEKQWHTLGTLTGIGTTEMAFRSDLVLEKELCFDEGFGPGAERYPMGEDFIFAMDLYQNHTKMLFLPIPIVKHPSGSTGNRLDEKVIFARGAMFARVFGYKAFIVDFLFAVKKYQVYKQEITFFSYLKFLFKGSIDYFRSSKEGKLCRH